MPDDKRIFEKAVELASIITGTDIELKYVNPRQTSSIHYDCGGKLLHGKGNWDIAPCRKCGIEVNTHLNAAKFIRDGGLPSLSAYEGKPVKHRPDSSDQC